MDRTGHRPERTTRKEPFEKQTRTQDNTLHMTRRHDMTLHKTGYDTKFNTVTGQENAHGIRPKQPPRTVCTIAVLMLRLPGRPGESANDTNDSGPCACATCSHTGHHLQHILCRTPEHTEYGLIITMEQHTLPASALLTTLPDKILFLVATSESSKEAALEGYPLFRRKQIRRSECRKPVLQRTANFSPRNGL